jgi:hypothetical protein
MTAGGSPFAAAWAGAREDGAGAAAALAAEWPASEREGSPRMRAPSPAMSAAIDAKNCGVRLVGVVVGAETAAAAAAVAAGGGAAAAGPPSHARCRMRGVADCDCGCRCGSRAPEGCMAGQRGACGRVEASAALTVRWRSERELGE